MANPEQTDRNQLISIFPTEIWLTILNHVHNITDYRKICQSSTVLISLFQPLRTKVLFPDVTKILLQRWRRNPQLLSNGSLCEAELIPLRLVCRSWRKAVDGTLQNLDFCYGDPTEKYTRLPFQVDVIRQPTVFGDDNDLQSFMEFFDSNSNPFITRSVVIVFITAGDRLQSFYNRLFEMLREFGHHIWYCGIVVRLKDSWDQVNLFTQLGAILTLMPNLKRFQYVPQAQPAICCSGLNLLKNAMTRHPIPTLKNLQFFNQSGMPVSVMQSLIQNNPQIKTIDGKYMTGQQLQVYLEEMPKLEALAIDMHNRNDFVCFRDSAVVCRLKKLNIQMPLVKVSWENVFSTLNFYFGETLEELCICLPNSNLYKGEDDAALHLAKLKELTISSQNIAGLDFLLPMRNNLEKLSLMVHSFGVPSAYQEQYTIKLYQMNGHVYCTNIWSLMEKLETFNVRFENSWENQYTRKSWSRV